MGQSNREKCKRWYWKHHNKELIRKKEKDKKLNDWLDSLKTPCINCGMSDVRCITFHHIRGPKLGSVSLFARRASRQRTLDEVSKCVCLCANCHAIEHHGQPPKGRQLWLT